MDNIITILGARGSVPVSGPAFSRYGGATTCILVKLGGQILVLDAGTGILNLPEEVLSLPELPLVLTHLHLDHLTGLPMCPYLFNKNSRLSLYVRPVCGLSGRDQLNTVFSPPFWPVSLEQLPAAVSFHSLPSALRLGEILVESIPGIHPDGVALLRLTGGGKRVVFATDCTLTPELFSRLAEFSRDCDLLLCDGQYTPGEWEEKKSFGHSTYLMAASLGRDCGARQVRIVHHDPARTDAALDAAAAFLSAIHPQCAFAREGEVIVL